MAISKNIIKYLDENKIKYEILEHRTVYTALDKAATLRVLPRIVGKTLTVKFDPTSLKLRGAGKNYALVLIAADKLLDKAKLKKVIKNLLKKQDQKSIKTIDFVNEAWMKKNFKGIQIGAVPPFGAIWEFPTFIDKVLLKEKKIIVNSGDYNSSLKILCSDLKKTSGSVFDNFSEKKPVTKSKKKPAKKIIQKKSKSKRANKKKSKRK